jgi:hypothetical protein
MAWLTAWPAKYQRVAYKVPGNILDLLVSVIRDFHGVFEKLYKSFFIAWFLSLLACWHTLHRPERSQASYSSGDISHRVLKELARACWSWTCCASGGGTKQSRRGVVPGKPVAAPSGTAVVATRTTTRSTTVAAAVAHQRGGLSWCLVRCYMRCRMECLDLNKKNYRFCQ